MLPFIVSKTKMDMEIKDNGHARVVYKYYKACLEEIRDLQALYERSEHRIERGGAMAQIMGLRDATNSMRSRLNTYFRLNGLPLI